VKILCICWEIAANITENARNNTRKGTLYSPLLRKCYSGNKIKKNEISRICIKNGEKEKYIQGFGGGT
jgi:hypothetical protein